MISTLALFATLQPAHAAPQPDSAELAADVVGSMELEQTITMKELGKKPRRKVELAPKAGATASMELVSTTGMNMSIRGPDGTEMPMPGLGDMLPTTVMTVKNVVSDPVADGLMPVTIEYVDVRVEGVEGEIKNQMMAGLQPIKGLQFTMLVAPDGRITQTDVSANDATYYEMIQSMADQYANQLPIFPAEPIGVGAEWDVNMDMSVGGMAIQAVQKITVTDVTADAISMDYELEMQIGQDGMAIPGLPPGAEVDISKFSGKGSGAMVTDLGTMMSLGTMKMDMDIEMSVKAEGQNMSMSMDMSQTTEMRAVTE